MLRTQFRQVPALSDVQFVEFWAQVQIENDDAACWAWLGATEPNGYGAFRMCGEKWGAHRVAWRSYNQEPIPDGRLIAHKCDNRTCCNPGHLYPASYKQNTQDMLSRKRHRSLKGQAHPLAKLTDTKVGLIRQKYAEGATGRSLAQEFGVSVGLISMIVTFKIWKHLSTRSASLVVQHHQRGEQHHGHRLTVEQVRQIRTEYEDTTAKALAIKYGVSKNRICQIVRREAWAWLD